MHSKQLSMAVALISSFFAHAAIAMPHYTDYGGSTSDFAETYQDKCGRTCVEDESGETTCTRVRKEIDDLSAREWRRYVQAFDGAMSEPQSKLKTLVNLYSLGFFSRGLHNNGAFLPWHRWFLLEVENELQEQDCRVTIPYYDWEHEGAVYDDESYDAMRNRLEHGPGLHDSIHCIVGGTMCSARSSNDPVFFSHHANIDKIWGQWQSASPENQRAHSGRVGVNRRMPMSTATPSDVLDLTNLPDGVQVHYADVVDE